MSARDASAFKAFVLGVIVGLLLAWFWSRAAQLGDYQWSLPMLDIAHQTERSAPALETPVPLLQNHWEFRRLLDLYVARKPMCVCEIGSYYGGSLYHWLRLAQPGAIVVSVDSYSAGVDNRHLYAGWVPAGVHFIAHEGDSRTPETIKRVDAYSPFDWVLIDGDHLEASVQSDWDNYSAMAAPGGVVALHDIVARPDVEWIRVAPVWRRIQAQGFVTQEITAGEAQFGIGICYL